MELITNWFRRHFSNPQVVFLALFLGILFLIVVVMGKMVAPILIAIVIAYLLEGLVGALESKGAPRLLAVVGVVAGGFVVVVVGVVVSRDPFADGMHIHKVLTY